ncbi:MAG TPA: fatty acyl-AMP ligase [Ktedonobacteraceae bacterium]|nr:fatty acyl-AMP ligase [Ktedonobacteraceae bacterium]
MSRYSVQANIEDVFDGDPLRPQVLARDASLVDILQRRSLLHPMKLAYKFLRYTPTGCSERDWTYQELDWQARSIGAALTHMGMFQKPVLLLFPSGLEYVAAFFGCLYAGAIAVPAYPPRRTRSTDRVQSILEDARPSVILTTSSIQATVCEWLTFATPEADIAVIAVDALEEVSADVWQKPPVSRDALAFLQYTSGSTATPKGVMVSHGNLLHNAALIRHYSQFDENNVCVSWLPIYHDMGLIAAILQPVYAGYSTVFMDPVQFLQFPMRWLYTISQHRGTISYAPNFAYEQCIRRAKPDDIASLDLSCWQIAVNGAEPIRTETIERFMETFAPCGFQPTTPRFAYGLAEATLVVTTPSQRTHPVMRAFDKSALEKNIVALADPQALHTQKLAGCGAPDLGQQVVIVHPEHRTRCAADEIGEIWIQGESVAMGYWQKPEVTEQIFHARLSESGEGPFLRTGDLGFIHEGHLYITGRIKDVIILNGRNHYPQDIELTMERSHPALHPGGCVAFAVEREGQEQLVVMAEITPRYRWQQNQLDGAATEIQAAIRRYIADAHDIRAHDVVLLQMGEILKTSSGKLQRRACRAKYLAGELNRWSA